MNVLRRKSKPRSLTGLVCLGALLAPTSWAQAGDVGFFFDEGQVVPTQEFAVRVSVLGAAIASGSNDLPVTVQVNIDGQIFEPFGAFDDPDAGDVNDHMPPRHFTVQQVFNPNALISVSGASWYDGSVYLDRNSHDESPSVKLLRHGDPVPNLAGFNGQQDAVEFVQQYIDPDTNKMSMHPNQSIYLFELGTTNLSSSAADFQDLVVLITLGTSPEALEQFELLDASYD